MGDAGMRVATTAGNRRRGGASRQWLLWRARVCQVPGRPPRWGSWGRKRGSQKDDFAKNAAGGNDVGSGAW